MSDTVMYDVFFVGRDKEDRILTNVSLNAAKLYVDRSAIAESLIIKVHR